MVTSVLSYIAAALAEIAGCFAFLAWLRLGKPVWWLIPGTASLMLFAYLLYTMIRKRKGERPGEGDREPLL